MAASLTYYPFEQHHRHNSPTEFQRTRVPGTTKDSLTWSWISRLYCYTTNTSTHSLYHQSTPKFFPERSVPSFLSHGPRRSAFPSLKCVGAHSSSPYFNIFPPQLHFLLYTYEDIKNLNYEENNTNRLCRDTQHLTYLSFVQRFLSLWKSNEKK